jgi:hypothetical protein
VTSGIATFAPALTDLRANALRYFGTEPVRLIEAGEQERPFSRLLRVRVESSNGPLAHLFVKAFKPKDGPDGIDMMRARVAGDFATTLNVHRAMSSHGDLGAVRPVACYPEHLMIVTEEVAGRTLLEELCASACWFPRDATLQRLAATTANVGRWIRAFQATDYRGGVVSPESLLDYIDVRLERLVEHADDVDDGRRRQVLDHVAWLCARIPAADLQETRVHSDLSLGNVLVPPGRVVVLDFAMAGWGTRLHDLTRVFVQIDLLRVKPHLQRSVVRVLQRSLVRGFDRTLTEDAPLFRLLVLLHRVNHLTTLTVNRARWPERAYNGFVRLQHLRWIDGELRRPAEARRTA